MGSKIFVMLLMATMFSSNAHAQKIGIEITYSETYELANVILALTPYGISDEWEVQKGTPYYKAVMDYFKSMKDHPILTKANYSREKWEDFLSFRTDAYAFEVTAQGKIARRIKFLTNKGHQPFDDHLALIQDFYEKSKFHEFYQAHLPYFRGIASRYKAYFMVDEMAQFLDEEFGTFGDNTKNLIVFSPLVNRMSCRREIDKNISAEFSTLALYLIKGDPGDKIEEAQRVSDMHLLFTEMDHGYVNPTTSLNAPLLKKKFHYKFWDHKSGYTNSDCFNEYMTWAVYDLFTLKYFPKCADQVNRDWQFQNNNRGFIASCLFGNKLSSLYASRKPDQKIKDLYPDLLNWAGEVEKGLKMPVLVTDTIVVAAANMGEPIEMVFSEPIQKIPVVDAALFHVVNGERQLIKVVELEADKTIYYEGKTLRLHLAELPKKPGLYGLTFNIQGRKYALEAVNGATVHCPTRLFIRVK